MVSGWWLRRGQKALAAGELEEARRVLTRVVEARPRWAEARLWLATVLSELGELENLREELARARELSGPAPVVDLFEGKLLLDHQRYGEARRALERALEGAPTNHFLPGYLALARWTETGELEPLEALGWQLPPGGSELAGRWLIELELRFPGGPGTDLFIDPGPTDSIWKRLARWRAGRYRARARRALEAGRPERALEALDRAEALAAADEAAEELRLEAHLRAIERRRDQLEHEPHDVDLRLDLVEDLLEVGLASEAAAALEPAEELITSIDPDRLAWRAGLALLRGRVLLEAGELEQALEALELAATLWTVEIEPLYFLMVVHLRLGHRQQGRLVATTLCSMDAELTQSRLEEWREACSG